MKEIEFSIVIPVNNEEENIPELYRRLTLVMEDLCAAEGYSIEDFEIIVVDDGSTDRSWQVIRELNTHDRRIKGISFSRNFGHHVAITAGMDHIKGRSVILMDGDLQDPPEEIPRLYEKYKGNYDLVYGIRQIRHDHLLKKMTSKLFWWILRRFSDVDIPQNQTMLRIMSRRLIEAVKEMRERARFIHGMIAWTGFSSTTLEIEQGQRFQGRSKYNVPKMFKLAFHAVTSFSTVPLRLAIYIGFMSSLISLIVGTYFIYRKVFFGMPILGYASIIVSIFFIGGIQLLIFGLFGEYLGRTYQEVQKRPLYIVKEHID